MSLEELAKDFQLQETEKQAHSLKTVSQPSPIDSSWSNMSGSIMILALSEYLQSRLKWRKRNRKISANISGEGHALHNMCVTNFVR